MKRSAAGKQGGGGGGEQLRQRGGVHPLFRNSAGSGESLRRGPCPQFEVGSHWSRAHQGTHISPSRKWRGEHSKEIKTLKVYFVHNHTQSLDGYKLLLRFFVFFFAPKSNKLVVE